MEGAKLTISMAGLLEEGWTPVITNGRDPTHEQLSLELIWRHVSKLVECKRGLPVGGGGEAGHVSLHTTACVWCTGSKEL